MNTYEGLFIVRPDIKEEDINNVNKTITDCIVKNGGVVTKEEPWGKKPLAYLVKKSKEGYLLKLEFQAEPAAIAKIDSTCRLNADILRTFITRKEA